MSKKSYIYKAYSIILLLTLVLSLISSIATTIISFNTITLLVAVASLLSLFFIYVEFSAIYTFSDMIEYDKNGKTGSFKKRPFAFSPKFYTGYGFVIFLIIAALMVIALVASFIVLTVTKANASNYSAFLIQIVLFALEALVFYITYRLKYKGFGGLMLLFMDNDKSGLEKQKPHILRLYGVFISIISVVSGILVFVSSIFSIAILLSHFAPITIVWVLVIILTLTISLLTLFVNCIFYFDLSGLLVKHMINNKIITSGITKDSVGFDENKTALISYEYTGGIYAISIWLFSIALVVFLALTILIVSFMAKTIISMNFGALFSTDFLLYLMLSVLGTILSIICMTFATYKSVINKDTNFTIYDSGIKGIAIVKDSFSHKVNFELNKEEIKSVSVQGMYLIINAKGTEYKIMLTSIDFKRRLVSLINSVG